MTQKTISILGCGWLGLPLGKALVLQGWQVKGSTTTPAKLSLLQEAGIQPFLLDLSQELPANLVAEFVQDAEWLIVAVPPKSRSAEGRLYPDLLQLFTDALEKKASLKVIFISSTSVYPNLNRTVTEADTTANPEENNLLRAEKLMQKTFGENITVIRFGGLMGPGREPGRFLAGKSNLPNAEAPVNMIHLDDCIGIITEVIGQNCLGQTFNACADDHPSRKAFFTGSALQNGLVPPEFSDEPVTAWKQISSEKLKKALSYTFRHPDPLA